MGDFAFGGTQPQNNMMSGGTDFMGRPINYGYQGGAQAFNNQTNQMGSDLNSQLGGSSTMYGGENGGNGFAFDMPGLDQIGAGVGIGSDLMSMYNAHKGLGLAKDQLSMQKKAYKDNVANRDRFVGNTQKAFG